MTKPTPATLPSTRDDQVHASNTRRAYAADWADFAAWCAEAGEGALPATPKAVAGYLHHLAEAGRKVATIQRRLAAIADRHRSAGLPTPTEEADVRRALRQIRRTIGVRQDPKAPVLVDDLRAMVATLPEDPRGLRDRALLLVGFAGAFRRSELVGIRLEHLRFTKRGVVVTIPFSKTNQVGEHEVVALAHGDDPATCPVRALRAWLQAAGMGLPAKGKAGPVFVKIDRHGKCWDRPLTPQYIAALVKRAVAGAGIRPDGEDDESPLDLDRYAAHSLRAGLVTSAALAGLNEVEIAETTRHKSLDTLRRYRRIADPFKRGIAGKIKL